MSHEALGYFAILASALAGLSYVDMLKKRARR